MLTCDVAISAHFLMYVDFIYTLPIIKACNNNELEFFEYFVNISDILKNIALRLQIN